MIAIRASGARALACVVIAGASAGSLAAQHPLTGWADAVEARFSVSQPVIDYTLRVDASDTTGFTVTMRVRQVSDTFRVAMVAHPEYDDRYWRYVSELRATSPAGAAVISLVDSALWVVTTVGHEAVLSYRLALPPDRTGRRAAHRPFVSSTGALVGGVHSFMYVVDATLAPAHVTLEAPEGWDIATGLGRTVDPHVFFAPSAKVLTDSPILLGRLRNWTIAVNGVPHRIAYLPAPGAATFDTTAFVGGIEGIVRQTIALFGRAPYRDYTFLLEDGAFGALEHANSVTLGVSSRDLAANPARDFTEIAHEYFHTWNILRIHPTEYGDVTYRTPPRSAGLWWSEGATMFYADLLVRRASLPTGDSTRIAHLARLLGGYYGRSGNHLLSPERVSRAAYGVQGMQLGDNTASTHLQGELLTAVLDLMVRRSTEDRHTIDDVMRAMMARHADARGFTSDDVAREVARVCGCAMHRFFAEHVHGAAPIDFNQYLGFIGLASRVAWAPALDRDGSPQPDLRVFAWQAGADSTLRLMVLDTASVWERAGLHTGDRILSINGRPVADLATFRAIVAPLRIGDSIPIEVRRADRRFRTTVAVSGYQRAVVTIEESPNPTPAQRARRDRWARGS